VTDTTYAKLHVAALSLGDSHSARTHSPVRMIQRMGRTGRKRAGRVVVLVTAVSGTRSTTYSLLYLACYVV
jgi:hypothetical protein